MTSGHSTLCPDVSGDRQDGLRLAPKPPIVIVDYDPGWPALFEAEKTLVNQTVGPTLLRIEHVGSTGVPGLAAKPIIDLMAGLNSLADAAQTVGPLKSIGYEYIPEYEDHIPERRFFRKADTSGGNWNITHHLHMVEISSSFWQAHLLFRDHLRAHPDDARRYEQLKRDLAERFGSDRDGYTDAKTEFIESLIERARQLNNP
jgi:GrpB-like predicted nucleotidyltransferase (UPF0157 family)